MRHPCAFLFSTFVLLNSSLLAVKISIEPVGQGNLVHITHGADVIFVDAGSCEFSHVAHRNRKALQEETALQLWDKDPAPQAVIANTRQPDPEDPKDDSSYSSQEKNSTRKRTAEENTENPSSGEPTRKTQKRQEDAAASSSTGPTFSSAESSHVTMGDVVQENQRRVSTSSSTQVRDAYKENTLQRIYDTLPFDEKGCKLVKTVLVTHPDADHYSFFPFLFDPEHPSRCHFKIQNVVLSGFFDDYNPAFQAWITACGIASEIQSPDGSEKIGQVICTGMADGSRTPKRPLYTQGDQVYKEHAQYARPYCSFLPEKTPIEERIEEALCFTPLLNEKNPPAIQIFAMNVGHSGESESLGARLVNEDSNANSIVLRVQGQGASMLLAGDAEGPTWNYITDVTRQLCETMETTYVLISHHGSNSERATPYDVFRYLLKPEACFVSAGRRGQYHHPHQDTVQMLLALPSIKFALSHIVSYFGLKEQPLSNLPNLKEQSAQVLRDPQYVHRRKNCRRAIFSTLDHGTLAIDLDKPEEKQITASLVHPRVYQAPLEVGRLSKLEVNNAHAYVLEEGVSWEETIREMRAYFRVQNTHVCFWVKATPRDKGAEYRTLVMEPEEGAAGVASLPTQPHFAQTQHILLNPTKKRFYWLEETVEDPEATANQGSSSSAAPPLTPAQTVSAQITDDPSQTASSAEPTQTKNATRRRGSRRNG